MQQILIKYSVLNHLQQVKCWFLPKALCDFIQLAFVNSRSRTSPDFSPIFFDAGGHIITYATPTSPMPAPSFMLGVRKNLFTRII